MRNSYMFNGFYLRNFLELDEDITLLLIMSTILLILVAFTAACSLTAYILQSMGLYRLAANRGMSNPGLAWIPFVGMFRAGSVADDISARHGARTYYGHFILIGHILSWSFSGISSSFALSSLLDKYSRRGGGRVISAPVLSNILNPIMSLAGVAIFIITIIALNKIYKCYNPAYSIWWTVLSVIFPFLQSVFLFIIRNRVPASEGWGAQPGMYPPQYNRQGGYYPPTEPPAYHQNHVPRENSSYYAPGPQNPTEGNKYQSPNDIGDD